MVTVNLYPLIPFLRVVGPVQAVTLATAKAVADSADNKVYLHLAVPALSHYNTVNP